MKKKQIGIKVVSYQYLVYYSTITMKLINKLIKSFNKKKILVLSGWGFRWLYSVWILKWLEELGIDKDIDAVFGVSIWAIVGWCWCSGMSADEIYNLSLSLSVDKFYGTDMLKKSGWILPNKKIKWIIDQHICPTFSELNKKLYVWVVDTNTAKYKLFDKWDLHSIILGSMSIPAVFPPVAYEDNLFVDWGLLNNFPVDLAKQIYPHHEIIWVALSKFQENQKIGTFWDNLSVCYDILMRSKLTENMKLADILFCRDINIPVLSLDKKKMTEAYNLGYKDCIERFK